MKELAKLPAFPTRLRVLLTTACRNIHCIATVLIECFGDEIERYAYSQFCLRCKSQSDLERRRL